MTPREHISHNDASITVHAKPRLALACGAFACVCTVSIFRANQKHECSFAPWQQRKPEFLQEGVVP